MGYGKTGTGTTTAANAVGQEIQRLLIDATGGTYQLTFGGGTTNNINWNDNAATIETRLETDIAAITDVSVNQITAGPDTGNFEIRFDTPSGNQLEIGVITGSLTGGSASILTVANGPMGGNPDVEHQRLTLNGAAGTFDLELDNDNNGTIDDSATLPFNATPAQVEAALEGFTGITEVTVRSITTGPNNGSMLIVFDAVNGGTFATGDVPLLEVDTTNLTGTAVVDPTHDGAFANPPGRRAKRFFENVFDSTISAGTRLQYDFDNAGGLGAREGETRGGDSGGPAFIDQGGGDLAVAGVVRGGSQGFGAMGDYTRVSAFETWITDRIDAAVAGAYNLVIDMASQFGGSTAGDDGDADTISLTRNGSQLEVWINSVLAYTEQFSNLTGITIDGSSDDDTLIVDLSVDDALPGSLTFNGNGGSDSLRVIGDGTTTGTYTPSGAPMDADGWDGTVATSDGTINFTGLEPVEISAMAAYTFETPNADDVITITDATGSGGEDAIQVTGTSGGVGFEIPTFFDITTLTIDTGANDGGAVADTVTVDQNTHGSVQGIDTLVIETGDGADVINAVHVEDSSLAVSVVGGAGNDTLHLSPVAMNMDDLESTITFVGGTGTDTVNARDDNQLFSDTYTVTSTIIGRFAFGGLVYDGTTENVNLNTGGGVDTLNVNSTSGTATTTIMSQTGGDIFNIAGSSLGGVNNFDGNESADTFNVDGSGLTAVLNIDGGTNVGVSGARDEVVVSDTVGIAVVAAVNYSTTSTTTFTGFGSTLTMDNVETFDFNGSAADNDIITVNGSTGDDDITVAPIASDRAIIFNGGNPFDGPPEVFANSLPGVSGGSVQPDLDLSGLAQAAGLQVQDNSVAVENRLYIYGQSDGGLSDGNAFDPFGFGAGLILPDVTAPTSHDVIDVTDTSTAITTNEGGGTALVQVNYDTSDFVQADPANSPAIVINAGEEGNPTTPPADSNADLINLEPSTAYKFQINGNDPDPNTTGVVPPSGDELTLLGNTTFDEVTIYATKDPGNPPVITIGFSGPNVLGFSFSSIEELPVINANTVNLIGDNNNTGAQDDTFVVKGMDVDGDATDGGFQEFMLNINGLSPENIHDLASGLRFNDVQNLNVIGHDGIDTLEISPFADDTPTGWGIDVFFDEGAPNQADGVQDLIVLHTSLVGGGVSEDIVVRPSGPDAGEIVVTNGSFGTPILDIDYVFNTDIIVHDDDGFLNDTDTLTLLGTDPSTPDATGQDQFNIDLTNDGMLANPKVVVTDPGNLDMILYRLRNFTNFSSLNIDGLAGDDLFQVVGDGDVTLNINGGLPTGSDLLFFDMTTNVDEYTIDPGATVDSGTVFARPNLDPESTINFSGIETIALGAIGLHANSGTGGFDDLTIVGTGGSDSIALQQVGPGGIIQTSFGPAIQFASFGGGRVDFETGAGDDSLSVSHNDAWAIGAVGFDAGAPGAGSDSFDLETGGLVNSVNHAAFTHDEANILVSTNADTTQYELRQVESAAIDLGDAVDTLTSNGAGGTNITPGASPGSGVIQPIGAAGELLLPLSLSQRGKRVAAARGKHHQDYWYVGQ